MKRLRKNSEFLRLLCKAKSHQRKKLLRTANKEQILCLCEICLNILSGNIPVDVKKLEKIKNVIRKIAKPSLSITKKKNMIVNQSGGFLSKIIPFVSTFLNNVLGI